MLAICLAPGCGSSNSKKKTEDNQITDPAKIKEALIGTWEKNDGDVYTFSPQGKLKYVSRNGTSAFEWALSDDGKTITLGQDLSDSETVLTIKLKKFSATTFKGETDLYGVASRPMPVSFKKVE